MIQLIDYKRPAFRLLIKDYSCDFYPPKTLFAPWRFLPLVTKVKGSTMGWNIKDDFISYNQIKKKQLKKEEKVQSAICRFIED